MIMPMAGLLLLLFFGGALGLLLCRLLGFLFPKLTNIAPFFLIPILAALGAFVHCQILLLAAPHGDGEFALFLGGYVFGGLVGAYFGLVLARLILHYPPVWRLGWPSS